MATGETWERDWRGDVMRQLKASAGAHQQTAVILERLTARLDEHDRRISALEEQPSNTRANVNVTSQVAIAALALGALLLSLATHVTLH